MVETMVGFDAARREGGVGEEKIAYQEGDGERARRGGGRVEGAQAVVRIEDDLVGGWYCIAK